MNINATLLASMIVLALLVLFSMKAIWPPLAAALDERASKIAAGLAAADKAKSELSSANQRVEAELAKSEQADLKAIQRQLAAASVALEQVVEFVANNGKSEIKAVFAGSVPYLKLAGIVFGGWQMARAALVAEHKLAAKEGDAGFYQAKIGTARFFADHYLSQAAGYRTAIVEGSAGVLALTEAQF